jgi:hypothetical protein
LSENKIGRLKSTAKPLYYVFNVKDDNGFVIVSGDDRVIPVLGYSYSGKFSEENQSPAFRNWMQHYSDQRKNQSYKRQALDILLNG